MLLHIQIDKLGAFYTVLIHVRKVNCFLIQCTHTFHQLRKAFFIIQRMSLRVDTRYFHRNIIDIRSFQGFQIVEITMIRFSVS